MNDWIVSAFAERPLAVGDKPEVLEGPVAMFKVVKVLLMKVLKIAAGLRTAEVMKVAIVSGSDSVVRAMNRLFDSFARGTGDGNAEIRRYIRLSKVTMTLVTSVNKDGVKLRSAGQRFRLNMEGRCVVR